MTDTEILDWLERNLMSLSHGRATCSVDMSGKDVHGQLVNEARGAGAGCGDGVGGRVDSLTNTKSSTALRHGGSLSLWAQMEGPGTRDAPRGLAWLIAQLYR